MVRHEADFMVYRSADMIRELNHFDHINPEQAKIFFDWLRHCVFAFRMLLQNIIVSGRDLLCLSQSATAASILSWALSFALFRFFNLIFWVSLTKFWQIDEQHGILSKLRAKSNSKLNCRPSCYYKLLETTRILLLISIGCLP